MAETVTCPDCGEEVDPRGLSGHMETHDNDDLAAGGDGAVAVPKQDVDVPDEDLEEALPAANVTDDAITFRSIQEIEVADEQMKEELLSELKQFIRGGSLRV
jgi:hypothetical protein